MQVARLCHFYGWSIEYVLELSVDLAELMIDAATKIEAHNMLINMRVADFPYLKKESRTRTYKEVLKRASFNESVNEEPMTHERLAKFLGGKLNG